MPRRCRARIIATSRFPAGDRKMTLKGADYLLHFSVPHFYFHVTTAYDILRHDGLEIGKDDFMGEA
jgi:uncharacterized protein